MGGDFPASQEMNGGEMKAGEMKAEDNTVLEKAPAEAAVEALKEDGK